MAKFLVGLILGIFVGALAAAYEPTLPEQLRTGLANVTTLVARGTEHAAQSVDRAAGNVADQAERTGQGPPPEKTAPPASSNPR